MLKNHVLHEEESGLIYNARTQRAILGLFLVLILPSFSLKNFSEGFFFIQLFFVLVILMLILIEFKFSIDESLLSYQILFLSIPIYKKVVYPNQITQLKFKRVGWSTKGAIIQVNKGFNIRVVNFVPQTIFEDLIAFAKKYDISINKSKDYLTLEKMREYPFN